MNAVEAVFRLAAGVILYAYVLYPAILALLARFFGRPARREDITPELTILIPVHNQPDAIREKLENTLRLDYPKEKMHIVVSSDGSDDGTSDVVRSFADRGVELVESPRREGKVAAQLRALPSIRGEVAVFTDASILLDRTSLRSIVRPFADRAVGCVSSEDAVPGGGEGAYVRYEMFLRRLEGNVHTLIGVSGSFYAVRSSLVEPTDPRYTRDFLVPLTVIGRGYRVVSEQGAVGRYLPASSSSSEFRRKVRTVMRGMDVLLYKRDLLDPFKHPFAAWALFSHKIARWLVPPAMIAALVSCAFLSREPLYALLLAAQGALYAGALAAAALPGASRLLPLRAALFFLVTNGAILAAWVRYLSGHRAVVWEPTKR